MEENRDNKLIREIEAEVFSIPIVDTHEYLISEQERRMLDLNIFFLFSHYTSTAPNYLILIKFIYGNQKTVRKTISSLLYKKIKSKYFTFEEGIEYAKKILYKNPLAFYSLN